MTAEALDRLAQIRPTHRPDLRCLDCGGELVLTDVVESRHPEGRYPETLPQTEEDVWRDEFTCPRCRNGVYLDWPEEQLADLLTASREPATRIIPSELCWLEDR